MTTIIFKSRKKYIFVMGTRWALDANGDSLVVLVEAETMIDVLKSLSLQYPAVTPRQWELIDKCAPDEPLPEEFRTSDPKMRYDS